MQRDRVTLIEQREALKQRHIRCLKGDPVTPAGCSVESRVKQKIQKIQNWEKVNPGLTWSNPQHETSEPKIYISKEMLESVAYRGLSRVGLLLLQDFLAKRLMKRTGKKHWVTENNGQIIFSYLEAESKGFSSSQFRNAIDELQSKGFIDIVHRGQGGRAPVKGNGDCTKYWVDDRWKFYATDNFKPARKPRRKDTRKGRGWSLIMGNPELKKQLLEKRTYVQKDRR